MNKNILKITILTLLLGTTLLSAKGGQFEQRKTIILSHLTQKISLTNTFKSCVSNSSKASAIKTCRQSYKASMKALRTETKKKKAALKGK